MTCVGWAESPTFPTILRHFHSCVAIQAPETQISIGVSLHSSPVHVDHNVLAARLAAAGSRAGARCQAASGTAPFGALSTPAYPQHQEEASPCATVEWGQQHARIPGSAGSETRPVEFSIHAPCAIIVSTGTPLAGSCAPHPLQRPLMERLPQRGRRRSSSPRRSLSRGTLCWPPRPPTSRARRPPRMCVSEAPTFA